MNEDFVPLDSECGQMVPLFFVCRELFSGHAFQRCPLEKAIRPHSAIEVDAIQVVISVEANPQKDLCGFVVDVNSPRVPASRDALEEEESALCLDQAFGPGFAGRQERAKHLPPRRRRGDAWQLMDREEVFHAQLAQQFSLGLATLCMHGGGPFVVDLVRDWEGGGYGFPVASQPRVGAQLSSNLRVVKKWFGSRLFGPQRGLVHPRNEPRPDQEQGREEDRPIAAALRRAPAGRRQVHEGTIAGL